MEVETETEDTSITTDTYTPVTAVRIWKKRYPKYKLVIIFLVLILMVIVILLAIGLSVSGRRRRGHVIRYEASSRMFRFSSVQAPTETCREIGVVIQTKYGGGAVDAAIAAAFCSGVVAMDASGLGGSLVAVVYKPPGNSSDTEEGPMSVVAQATAPQLANRLMFYNHPDPNASSKGGLSVAVPGELSGLYSLWGQFGTLPWADLVVPSILILQDSIDTNNTNLWPNRQPTGSGQPDTEVPSLRLPLLLQTLSKVAADPMSFYNGTLANDIVADLQDNGGIMSAADLAAYQPLIGPALSLPLPDVNLTLYTTPPPSGGIFVNHVLTRLNSFHHNLTVSGEDLPRLYGEMMDAFKAGFSKLLRWDSSEHKDLTSIHDGTDSYSDVYEEPTTEDNISNEITVIGLDGTCIVITLSLNSRFGSGLVGTRTGILFNNAMSSFTVIKDHEDFDTAWHNHHISPRAMSRSYMTPLLSTDNSHQVLLVSAGGAAVTALTGLTQVLHYWLYRNKTLEKAVGLPRMHYNPANGHHIFEDGFDWQYLSDYEKHNNYPKMVFIPHGAAVDAVRVLRHQTSWSRDWWLRKYVYVISDGRHDTGADGF